MLSMSSLAVFFTVFCVSSLLYASSVVNSTILNPDDQRGITLCEECPPSCENPVGMGECCLVCDVDMNDCNYNGLMIEHGQSFHPTSDATDAPINSSASSTSHCSTCTCTNGVVECTNTCPELDCTGESYVPNGSCCPVCSKCVDIDGRNFSIGESWHPSYPFYGLLSCMNCTCVDHIARCVKLPCPDIVLPPCPPDAQEDEVILCCPKCTLVTPQVEPTQNTSTIAIRNYTNGTIDPIAIKPCPKPYTFRIWKHREEDAMVLEDTVEMPVDIWRWASVNGSYIRTTEKLNSLSIPFMYDYNFMGWCKARRVNGLSSKHFKRQRIASCISSCADLVTKLLRVKPNCGETSV